MERRTFMLKMIRKSNILALQQRRKQRPKGDTWPQIFPSSHGQIFKDLYNQSILLSHFHCQMKKGSLFVTPKMDLGVAVLEAKKGEGLLVAHPRLNANCMFIGLSFNTLGLLAFFWYFQSLHYPALLHSPPQPLHLPSPIMLIALVLGRRRGHHAYLTDGCRPRIMSRS